VRVVGHASGEWYRVDVVVRGGDAVASEALTGAVRARLADEADGPAGVGEPESTYSFDGDPPEGGAGVGVWVRRPTIGAAVDAAVELVTAEAEELAGHPVGLWDVRAIPLTAVLRNPAEGSVATLEASTESGPLDS
jgi:hypothetical protein